ncbi:Ubiquitin thioesterase OTUB1 [Myotis brandtii]|uniref:Ubiquitin thioesterase OTUB1 n=1 Tax=Myotis brandtii TaxID=109478 RepID=S7PEV1_MYOBR|nr:Ubiquitin thioesterase OTUB1 [Myotis brandtii]
MSFLVGGLDSVLLFYVSPRALTFYRYIRVNCLAYDEAIMAQQDRIQQEIAVQNPLVSERLELSVLYKEYAEDDNIYQQKIKVGAQLCGQEAWWWEQEQEQEQAYAYVRHAPCWAWPLRG